jgi:predicted HTH domain antitoxin
MEHIIFKPFPSGVQDKTMYINYPSMLPDAMHLTFGEFEEEAKMAMAVKLFEMKKISSGIAASIAGIGRVSFLLKLHRYGVNMINMEIEELFADIENA